MDTPEKLDRPFTVAANQYTNDEFFKEHLSTVNLFSEGSITSAQPPDLTFQTNAGFWAKILPSYNVLMKTVCLEKFQLIDWYPRSPGKFHTADARYLEHEAKMSHKVRDKAGGWYFDPYGKIQMMEAGYGAFRFNPIYVKGETYRLCTATSDGICHSGIPLAIPESFFESNHAELHLCYDFIGKVVSLPDILKSHFQHQRRIPQIYVRVDELKEKSRPDDYSVDITPTIFFTSDKPLNPQYVNWVREYGYVTYVTCRTNSNIELDDASDWLESYVTRYKGEVLTNYDEMRPAFSNVPFSLQRVRSGTVIASNVSIETDHLDVQGAAIIINAERVTKNDINVSENQGNVNIAIGKKISQKADKTSRRK